MSIALHDPAFPREPKTIAPDRAVVEDEFEVILERVESRSLSFFIDFHDSSNLLILLSDIHY